MYEPTFGQRDIMNVNNYNFFVRMLANGQPIKPFSVSAMPPVEGNDRQVEKLKELSHLKYGRERGAVEKEIQEKYMNL